MTKKNILKNIQTLKNIRDNKRGKVSTTTLQKVNKLVDLYEDRKISQLDTALNLIMDITSRNDKTQKKALKKYEKTVEKYENIKPISERMEATVQKAQKGAKKARITTQLKKRVGEEALAKASATITRKAREKFISNRKTYAVKYMLFSRENRTGAKKATYINGIKYYTLLTKPAVRNANVKSQEWIEQHVNEAIPKSIPDRDGWNPLFKRMVLILQTDSEVKNLFDGPYLNYTDAIRIESAERIDDDGRDYNVLDDDLTDASRNVSIYHTYIETEVDTTYLNLKEAIQKKHYRENECWINALYDHYSQTLMKHKRGSLAKNLTREKILQSIGLTDEEFSKNGASINQMEVIFKQFGIPVRLYDCNSNLIYKYTPENFARHVIFFYGLIKNSHIYVLNHNLNSLNRKQEQQNTMTISNNYHISQREEPVMYDMITSIDDLLKLNEKEEYQLIYQNNNLAELVSHLKDAGYEPQVRFQGNKISQVKVKLTFKSKSQKNTVEYTISTQNLAPDKIDEDVQVSCVDKYDRVSQAMFKFNKKIFSEAHKSYYNEVDVNVLDECRTIVPNGLLKSNLSNVDVREIDVCKAFTKSLCDITHIPVFCEFDVWKVYGQKCDVHKMSDLTFYIVKPCQGNLFFNKKHCLVHGKLLKQLLKDGVIAKILYYKQPSFKHKVNYKKYVDDLFNEYISHDKFEDEKIKKNIANINMGLLEKGSNNVSKSKMFNNLKEAIAFQKANGGKLYVIDDVAEEELMLPISDDVKVGEVNEENNSIYLFNKCGEGIGWHHYEMKDGEMLVEQTQKTVSKYYIHNISKSRKLMNGFRWIKEMLLQNHNHRMYKAYSALKEKGIEVYAVKTDAFHISKADVKKAKRVLTFHSDIGGWRVERSKMLRPPTEKYFWKHNELPKIPVFTNTPVDVEDEWDTEPICHKIMRHKQVLIRGKVPGTGKSYIAEYFSKLDKNVLFVVPTNRLLQEKQVEATTYNRFFSIAVDAGEKLPPYDHSSFDVICLMKCI